mmetsp:Transcript_79930/g.141137  ORF Transcript_79930/g.141137 Transcript_79930/m.141137 type:complete len:414 (-) Transcript_79930:1491-2732(-)
MDVPSLIGLGVHEVLQLQQVLHPRLAHPLTPHTFLNAKGLPGLPLPHKELLVPPLPLDEDRGVPAALGAPAPERPLHPHRREVHRDTLPELQEGQQPPGVALDHVKGLGLGVAPQLREGLKGLLLQEHLRDAHLHVHRVLQQPLCVTEVLHQLRTDAGIFGTSNNDVPRQEEAESPPKLTMRHADRVTVADHLNGLQHPRAVQLRHYMLCVEPVGGLLHIRLHAADPVWAGGVDHRLQLLQLCLELGTQRWGLGGAIPGCTGLGPRGGQIEVPHQAGDERVARLGKQVRQVVPQCIPVLLQEVGGRVLHQSGVVVDAEGWLSHAGLGEVGMAGILRVKFLRESAVGCLREVALLIQKGENAGGPLFKEVDAWLVVRVLHCRHVQLLFLILGQLGGKYVLVVVVLQALIGVVDT